MQRDVIHSSHQPGQVTGPVGFENSNRPKAHARRNSDDAESIIQSTDRACDVRPMTVAVGSLAVDACGGEAQ